jgi:type I restriction enzyme S subunit
MEAIGVGTLLDTSLRRCFGEVKAGYTAFRENDLVAAKITPCFENGKIALLDRLPGGFGFGTTELHVLRPGPEVDPRFLLYLAQSYRFKALGESEMYGAGGQKRVPETFILDFPVSWPPRSHQSKIAAFLDCKTAAIDSLIIKEERLIELLQEERQALITNAVTKGLNPKAPMRDSRIEWLGEIPRHWQILKLKYITPNVTVGIVVTPSRYYVEEGPDTVPCPRSFNVRRCGIDHRNMAFISMEGNQLHSKSILRKGDLVAVRTGQPGTTAVIDEALDGANCVDLIIIRQSPTFDSRFLCHFLNSAPAQHQYGAGAEGALQQHFNVETAKELLVSLPPRSEQASIMANLDSHLDKHNRLMATVERHRELLCEYRRALISDAVSGNINVIAEDAK